MSKYHSRLYTGESLGQIAFPLGGIGTGTLSLGGRGNLQDWEFFNSPNKGGNLSRTFLALRAKPARGPAVARILEREFLPPYTLSGSRNTTGGGGFALNAQAGLPRFREVEFHGEYPFAWLEFRDKEMPVEVSLEAFNPFIPMNVEDSSIPGAILRYRVRNRQAVSVEVSLLSLMQNPVGFSSRAEGSPEAKEEVTETINCFRQSDGLRGLFFSSAALPESHPDFGTACLTTDRKETDVQTHLYRGR
jgi:uncharacterized protein (DUF608 family)